MFLYAWIVLLALFVFPSIYVIGCRWLIDHARDYEDVEITNRTDEMACISIAGPLSRNVLSKITDEDVTSKSFKFMKCREMNVAGVPVLALRVSYTGKCCWYVCCDACIVVAMWFYVVYLVSSIWQSPTESWRICA